MSTHHADASRRTLFFMKRSGALFALAVSLAATSAFAQGKLPTLVVVPLQPAQSEIPALVVQRLSDLAVQELRKGGVVQLANVASSLGGGTEDPGIAAVRQADKLYAAGREQYRKQEYEEASKSFGRAVKLMEENLANVSDYGFFADVYLWSGLALFRAGNADDATLALERALLVRPDLQADPRKVDSPVFLGIIEKLRKSLRERPRGSLIVATTPSGCELLVNGVLRGKTPVDLRGVPSGWHNLRAACPGHTPAAAAREVKPNQPTQVDFTLQLARNAAGALTGPDPLPPLIGRLRRGLVNNESAALLQEVAMRSLADFAVVGYFLRESGDYLLRGYLLRTQDSRLVPLPDARFDLELLTAGQEAGRFARSVEKALVSMPPVELRAGKSPTGDGTTKEIRTAGDLARAENLLAREEIERLAREERERRLGLGMTDEGPAADKPVYKKWWFWTVIGAAVVGGALAGFIGASSGGTGTANVGIRWTPPR